MMQFQTIKGYMEELRRELRFIDAKKKEGILRDVEEELQDIAEEEDSEERAVQSYTPPKQLARKLTEEQNAEADDRASGFGFRISSFVTVYFLAQLFIGIFQGFRDTMIMSAVAAVIGFAFLTFRYRHHMTPIRVRELRYFPITFLALFGVGTVTYIVRAVFMENAQVYTLFYMLLSIACFLYFVYFRWLRNQALRKPL
ncbi:hypothetical protein FLK61_24535 [Paenalkalicoccus suaedae]|uniref:Uncharacterized protein n=1 Tax=Paenalkalicoccus suaedae TaxID=2592382 RepID=A0A859FAK5_9BACI|nr:hypothetical protein [Paenalkalicoccus suaedae]QKS69950.1 hypothetical protein FLK61_24535 [Paenalkalicoccus suaedae]